MTVFGCGGDRDRTKRPLMGAVAARLSDLVILTSDNPRSEDPAAIIEDIKRGWCRRNGRAEAGCRAVHAVARHRRPRGGHHQAVVEARAGDVVLIAGKGHESTQTIGDRVLPFEDGKVARAALRRRQRRRAMSIAPFALTAREMAAAFGGVLTQGPDDRLLPTVSIDTRTIAPGDLFVAIRGPRFDGHAFVADIARGRGCRGREATARPRRTATTLPVIVVADTLYGLQEAAGTSAARRVHGGRDHGQRRQDDDQGDHGDVLSAGASRRSATAAT